MSVFKTMPEQLGMKTSASILKRKPKFAQPKEKKRGGAEIKKAIPSKSYVNSLFKRLLKNKLKYAYEWKLNDSLTFPRENSKSVTSSWPTAEKAAILGARKS